MGVETELREHMEAIEPGSRAISFGAHPDPLSGATAARIRHQVDWSWPQRCSARPQPTSTLCRPSILCSASQWANTSCRCAGPCRVRSWELERSRACKERLGIKPGETTPDQLFTLRQWNVWRLSCGPAHDGQ